MKCCFIHEMLDCIYAHLVLEVGLRFLSIYRKFLLIFMLKMFLFFGYSDFHVSNAIYPKSVSLIATKNVKSIVCRQELNKINTLCITRQIIQSIKTNRDQSSIFGSVQEQQFLKICVQSICQKWKMLNMFHIEYIHFLKILARSVQLF